MAEWPIQLAGPAIIKKLTAAQQALKDLRRVVLRAGLVVAGRAQKNVSGRPGLRVQTGRLRQSIHARAFGKASVRIGTNLIYARIHEFGGTIRHPGGTAYFPLAEGGEVRWISNKEADRFAAKRIFFPRTKPHNIRIPRRSYLRLALRQERHNVRRIIRQVYAGPLHFGGLGDRRA